jgi:predicted RNA binding protein YcfA (HicA-like mRNA interferase family)
MPPENACKGHPPLRYNKEELTKSGMRKRGSKQRIEEDGWYQVAMRGSHRQYKHPAKPGRVAIAGRPGHDLAPGTLNSVLKQARLK